MTIETGNAGEVETRGTGWVLGFSEWTREQTGLRHVPAEELLKTLCVKWAFHPAGDPRGTGKPLSTGRTISLLVAGGPFRIDFAEDATFARPRHVALVRVGDYVIWGADLHHRWFAEADSTVMTVRWESASAGR